MTAFVALIRAVNVGGTGKLPMSDLKAMCEEAGFKSVKTYIASGNVVFTADLTEARVKAELEQRLADYDGRPVGVLVRTAAEMAQVRDANPFPGEPANKVVAMFLDAAPPKNAAEQASGAEDEVIKPGSREIYVFYPKGQGLSKLKVPAAKAGTARNMNTVAKLAQMAAALA